ncbi:MAG: hypothetical protein AAB393_16410, partial [Bacteroidota bacterium]
MNPRFLLNVLCISLLAVTSFAQRANKDSSFILLIVPESDTTTTSSSAYRLSASTNPGSKVTINDKPYKLYSSGAFVGLLELQVGEVLSILLKNGVM